MFNPILSFYFRTLLTFQIKKKKEKKKRKKKKKKGRTKISIAVKVSIAVQFLQLVHSPKVNFCACEEFEENPLGCFGAFRA